MESKRRTVKTLTFGEVIRTRRRRLFLSPQEVARRIKTSASFVDKLEADKRHPSDATITKLAEVLGLDRYGLFLLANPEAGALQHHQKAATSSIWDRFEKDGRLQRAYGVSGQELEMLSQVELMGDARSTHDLVYILKALRQVLAQ
jgi:transcriptional regulator with XRE-family HTH domain